MKAIQIIEFSTPYVICDFCDEDYTLSDEKGGFLFQSKAVCPKCSDRMMKTIKEYEEEHFIRATANEDESFKDFIHRIRKPKD